MARTRVGLDIGSTGVRAAELAAGDPPTLLRAAQVPLPPGAVENGEVRQPQVVGEALRELWQRGGFKSKQVVMGVGNQRVVVREITIPWLPEKELRASLAFQVQEFIPMSTDEAILDYDPLGEQELEDGRRMVRMLLVAAQKVMVNAIVEAADAAKLEPVGLDLMPFALVRAAGTPEGRHGARHARRRGGHRHRRARHEHLRARRADHAVRPHPALRRARRDPGHRARPGRRGRRRRGAEAGGAHRGRARRRGGAGASPWRAPARSWTRSVRRWSSTRPRCPGRASGGCS